MFVRLVEYQGYKQDLVKNFFFHLRMFYYPSYKTHNGIKYAETIWLANPSSTKT